MSTAVPTEIVKEAKYYARRGEYFAPLMEGGATSSDVQEGTHYVEGYLVGVGMSTGSFPYTVYFTTPFISGYGKPQPAAAAISLTEEEAAVVVSAISGTTSLRGFSSYPRFRLYVSEAHAPIVVTFYRKQSGYTLADVLTPPVLTTKAALEGAIKLIESAVNRKKVLAPFGL